jgi:hypothetical protein
MLVVALTNIYLGFVSSMLEFLLHVHVLLLLQRPTYDERGVVPGTCDSCSRAQPPEESWMATLKKLSVLCFSLPHYSTILFTCSKLYIWKYEILVKFLL